MTEPQTVGQRLFQARLQAAIREGRQVTQADVAQMVGVKDATVSRYEAGKAEPDLGMIVLLAAALGVTPGWLAFGEASSLTPTLGPPIEREVRPVPRPVPRPAPRSQTPRRRKSG